MKTVINVLGRPIGKGHPSFIIGEIGLNHNGDLEIAKQLIQIAAIAGCSAVKFQKRDVANLAIASVLDSKDERFPLFGSTYREIRNHLEFNQDQYKELIDVAEKCHIGFLCTAFDIPSVDFLETLEVKAYKLASHSLTNIPLLKYIATTKKPTILSTGMSNLEEIDQAVDIFRAQDTPLILLHCVSSYPQPIEESNLKLIDRYQDRYHLPVGYSGHEIGWLATLAAIARGASVIERHITLDNKMIGFDHKLSLMPDELIRMIREIRLIESGIGTGEKKVSAVEQITRNKYHVSWVSKMDIPKGTLLTEEMLTLKNPGTGIPSYKKDLLVGKKAKINIIKDTLLEVSHVE